MPNLAPTDFAVVKPSPVAIIILKPEFFRACTASGVLALIGSETANNPTSFPSTAKCITLAPSALNCSA